MTDTDATRITELQTELAQQQVKIEAMDKELNMIVKNMTIQSETMKNMTDWMKRVHNFFGGAKVGD